MTDLLPTTAQPAHPDPASPTFAVISGEQVQKALAGRERQITDLVEATYRLHGAGDSVNPPSYFLRFPGRPPAARGVGRGDANTKGGRPPRRV
ncbi:2,3-diaminopropionate biosynthesis protein SbnB, partial [Streptomyces griseoluteus]